MSDYVTLAEAVSLTGKSLSTIRRLAKRLPNDAVKKEGDKYLIKRSVFGLDSQDEVSVVNQVANHVEYPSDNHSGGLDNQLIEAYRSQIQMQAEELRVKNEQIAQLLERQHETNILLNQRQLPIQETPTTDEKRNRQAGWVLIGLMLALLGFATYVSWRF